MDWQSVGSTMKDAAQSYCQIRLLMTAVACIVMALSTCVVAVWFGFGRMKTAETTAVIQDGTVSWRSAPNKKTTYTANLRLTYTVQNREYTASTSRVFDSEASAKEFIKANQGKTQTLWYDPKSPSSSSDTKPSKKTNLMISASSVLCVLIMIGCAIWNFYMRSNPLYCGITVLGDTTSAIGAAFD